MGTLKYEIVRDNGCGGVLDMFGFAESQILVTLIDEALLKYPSGTPFSDENRKGRGKFAVDWLNEHYSDLELELMRVYD